jgi:polysaccharide pyruvyl transferase WcaK-like protein
MKRILLYTAAGEYNLGDDCILSSEVQYLTERYPEAEIYFATYERNASPDLKGAKPISYFPNQLRKHPFRNIGFLLQNILHIWKADCIIVGGGGLFYDTEEGQAFASQKFGWGIRFFWMQFFRKPVIFWSVGLDLSHAHLREVSWWFTYKRARVSVRDAFSEHLLAGIGVGASVIPDPVFLREPSPKVPKDPVRKLRIGLALRSGYLEKESYTIELMVRHLQARGFEPIFLSHSIHTSNPLCNDVGAFEPLARSLHVAITHSLEETLSVYPTLDAMISMRLHASILSVVEGIPFYALSYGQKTRSILQALELSFIQDARSFNLPIFKTQLEELLDAKDMAEFAIRSKSATIKEQIHKELDILFHGL